jgi:hypothetical protein
LTEDQNIGGYFGRIALKNLKSGWPSFRTSEFEARSSTPIHGSVETEGGWVANKLQRHIKVDLMKNMTRMQTIMQTPFHLIERYQSPGILPFFSNQRALYDRASRTCFF